MKLTEEIEVSLRYKINSKKAFRSSNRIVKKIRSRACRRVLNRDLTSSGNIFKIHRGHEY